VVSRCEQDRDVDRRPRNQMGTRRDAHRHAPWPGTPAGGTRRGMPGPRRRTHGVVGHRRRLEVAPRMRLTSWSRRTRARARSRMRDGPPLRRGASRRCELRSDELAAGNSRALGAKPLTSGEPTVRPRARREHSLAVATTVHLDTLVIRMFHTADVVECIRDRSRRRARGLRSTRGSG